MEKIIKDIWLTKVKKGIVAVVESPYAPNNHNCIWLKQGTMYVYGNSGWEELSSSGGDTPEPEPEPLDPKYVRTPIEFVNFESKSITIEGDSWLCSFSDMISVQEEATEYQEGSVFTWKAPGEQDYRINDTPTLINGDSTGDDAETFLSVQQVLSVAYPNNTIELVSMTNYRMYEACVIIAEVDGSRKTFVMEYYNEAPAAEGQSYTMEPPAEPVVNETDFLRMFPREIYPITGFTPTVFNKWEQGEWTYAMVGYYSNSSVDYDYFKNFEDGQYQYIPAIDGTSSGQLWGLRDVNDEKKLLYYYNHSSDAEDTINPILPIGQQYLYYDADNGYVAITKDPNDLSKRMIFIEFQQYQIPGTGLSYDDILKGYFDVDNIADIPSISIDLYRYNPYH